MHEVVEELRSQKVTAPAVSGSPFVIDGKIQEMQQQMGDVRKCIAEVVEHKGRIEWLSRSGLRAEKCVKAASRGSPVGTEQRDASDASRCRDCR